MSVTVREVVTTVEVLDRNRVSVTHGTPAGTSNLVTLNTAQTITGDKTFRGYLAMGTNGIINQSPIWGGFDGSSRLIIHDILPANLIPVNSSFYGVEVSLESDAVTPNAAAFKGNVSPTTTDVNGNGDWAGAFVGVEKATGGGKANFLRGVRGYATAKAGTVSFLTGTSGIAGIGSDPPGGTIGASGIILGLEGHAYHYGAGTAARLAGIQAKIEGSGAVNRASAIEILQSSGSLSNRFAIYSAMTSRSEFAAGFTIKASGITDVPAILRGFAGQTASLEEWQDSAATTLVKMTPTGQLDFVATGRGPIIVSPVGNRFRIIVNDAGALSTVAA